jgi:hypothetical protein
MFIGLIALGIAAAMATTGCLEATSTADRRDVIGYPSDDAGQVADDAGEDMDAGPDLDAGWKDAGPSFQDCNCRADYDRCYAAAYAVFTACLLDCFDGGYLASCQNPCAWACDAAGAECSVETAACDQRCGEGP